MNGELSALSPIRIGNVLLKNRIVSAPTTMHSMSNGELYPTEDSIQYFVDRAKAGVGMVTCGGVKFGEVFDDGWNTAWDLNVRNHRHKIHELSERIHYYGAKASMELIGIFPDGYTVSDGCSIMGSPPVGREIPVEEMEKFKQGYADAAYELSQLGYDAILLHFGHSIPIAQFLSPLTNKRTDEYGGSTENRVRYINEILDAIRAKIGNKMLIEVRISGDEFEEGGIDPEESMKIAEMIQDRIDILQVSAGMHNPKWMCWTHPCGFRPPTPNVYLAEMFKKSGKFHVPIVTLGAIGNLEEADEIIATGKADIVTIARGLIADPELIKKGLEGRSEDVTPCIKCMRCHDSTVFGTHFQCAVNPKAGLEVCLSKLEEAPEFAKKVAVIGGGPAGMKAALVAAERGHYVTLFEQSDSLGGALKFADFVSFKYPLANYKNWLIKQVEKAAIEVCLNTKATPEMIEDDFDAVIIAVGAEPLIIPVPGVENAKIATSVYGKEEELGKEVIVIGGGQVGVETALHLAKMGIKASVIEMQSELAPDASTTHRNEILFEIEKEDNFVTICGATCKAVTSDSVTYEKDGEEVTLKADTVILSAGMKAKTAEADSFLSCAPEFAEIGDCVRARTVEQATKEAFYAANNL